MEKKVVAFLRIKKLAKCVAKENTETSEEKLEVTMGWLVLGKESIVANQYAAGSVKAPPEELCRVRN